MTDADKELLRELGIDPDAPTDPNFVPWCGACHRGDHENCSNWCHCDCEYNQ